MSRDSLKIKRAGRNSIGGIVVEIRSTAPGKADIAVDRGIGCRNQAQRLGLGRWDYVSARTGGSALRKILYNGRKRGIAGIFQGKTGQGASNLIVAEITVQQIDTGSDGIGRQ